MPAPDPRNPSSVDEWRERAERAEAALRAIAEAVPSHWLTASCDDLEGDVPDGHAFADWCARCVADDITHELRRASREHVTNVQLPEAHRA